MQVIHEIEGIREQVAVWRAMDVTVALVPTMGNLHDGHLRLVADAADHADRVMASIFVNPTQFGPNEDFASYPRTLEADCEALHSRGVDAVFAPAAAAMYPGGGEVATRVEVPGLSDILCGASRPGHFAGVATVVTKLLNITRPDVAVFGRKDYQQLRVIERVVADLNMPVRVVGSPVVREADGLAMSSRNAYLDADERARAPHLYRALRAAAVRLEDGAADYRAVEDEALAAIAEAGLEPEYVRVADPVGLQPATSGAEWVVILAAARLGSARLIDNVEVALDALGS